jgi:hypothetical protein
MKAGARKDAVTPEGHTALHIAAQNGHTQVFFFFLFPQSSVSPFYPMCYSRMFNLLLAYVQPITRVCLIYYSRMFNLLLAYVQRVLVCFCGARIRANTQQHARLRTNTREYALIRANTRRSWKSSWTGAPKLMPRFSSPLSLSVCVCVCVWVGG